MVRARPRALAPARASPPADALAARTGHAADGRAALRRVPLARTAARDGPCHRPRAHRPGMVARRSRMAHRPARLLAGADHAGRAAVALSGAWCGALGGVVLPRALRLRRPGV